MGTTVALSVGGGVPNKLQLIQMGSSMAHMVTTVAHSVGGGVPNKLQLIQMGSSIAYGDNSCPQCGRRST